MDSDFWTSRLAAAKRQYTLQQHHHQSSQIDRLSIDDFEVEDDVRPDFPCPYCYEDFDIASLCSHLEDEHSCESKVTSCLMLLYDSYAASTFPFQRRRRLRRVAIPSSQALSLLGRDLREAHLQVLLGGSGYRSSNANISNAATDPFLSSLILNFPSSEAEEISKSVVTSTEDTSAKSAAPTHMWKTSFDPSLSHEEREKRIRQEELVLRDNGPILSCFSSPDHIIISRFELMLVSAEVDMKCSLRYGRATRYSRSQG
ncbi:protein DEHYDRATION-INDUCED 19 [Citrus sinensis]|uniref:Protein DEHYDRATION-INDUCED 19 n=1 Tax=Citrus sinensis TaxID=2711 RepID=A0ACB8NG06_CITSI|nr:protein DEHYDRATION-INDUCED 19 [Citrus sinensis]